MGAFYFNFCRKLVQVQFLDYATRGLNLQQRLLSVLSGLIFRLAEAGKNNIHYCPPHCFLLVFIGWLSSLSANDVETTYMVCKTLNNFVITVLMPLCVFCVFQCLIHSLWFHQMLASIWCLAGYAELRVACYGCSIVVFALFFCFC